MTKITILGSEPKEKELKKIEFVHFLGIADEIEQCQDFPKWEYIELVALNYTEYDLMFAHDGNRSEGTLYLGHFNDGIV